MKKYLFFILFTGITLHLSNAQLVNQRQRADSLKRCYTNMDELDKNQKGNLYFSLALTMAKFNLDSAFIFAEEGIEYSKSIDYEMLTGRMYLAKASLYKFRNQYSKAIETYDLNH